MKATTYALGALLASVAVAHPRQHNAFHNHQKRQAIEWVTDVVYTTEIDYFTTTIWVSEGYVAPTTASASTTSTPAMAAQFFEGSQSSSSPSVVATTLTIMVSPIPASTPSTTSTPVASTSTTASPVVAAVQTPVETKAAAPVTAEIPATAAPIIAAAVAPTSTTSAAPVSTASSSSDTSGSSTAALLTGTNAGSIFQFGDPTVSRETFWTSGSCGLSTYFADAVPSTMPLVAMPSTVMANYGASQHNTLCGKIITMTRSDGITQTAAIADTNVSVDNSIDMTSDLWINYGQPADDGSIIKWLSWTIHS